ncbi:hypothetical protein [Kribbia dieselivorans]|uniref:hypothetical protein n=1 Tax=Kribbia dieselivorans TaxID=331526 RepID=UPI0012EEAF15|nr:hypothetical protein [Kribbia dieselivorans]
MRRTRSGRLLPTTIACAGAIIALGASPTLATAAPPHTIIKAELVGSMPEPMSPVIADVNPGGLPWVNGPSRVRVREDGRIKVDITRLVVPPPRGTGVNPVAAVVATLVCDGAVHSSTTPFPLNAAGNGRTSQRIAVPRHCEDPAVLIQPAANRGAYIASTVADDDHDD